MTKINSEFIKKAIEDIQPAFFGTELFAYMAINGGYELPFQSFLGKKIQDELGENYWVNTNKNNVDILIKNLDTNKNDTAIEVGHYQLQQSFSGNSKLYSDIFEKAENLIAQFFTYFYLQTLLL